MEGYFALMIPILAIIGAFGTKIAKIIMEADERKLALRLQHQQNGGPGAANTIDELRAEIASLREISGQYDLSLDNTMHRLERRIQALETGARTPIRPAPAETEDIQHVGQNL
ncbi:MAG: hypothetical protein ABIY70_28640 [Capsulimonas sp.]|uniref:hypothetical protein n=1 Tax=Capsulimonas sp. TaxID=2494211 RepID=UPI003263F705